MKSNENGLAYDFIWISNCLGNYLLSWRTMRSILCAHTQLWNLLPYFSVDLHKTIICMNFVHTISNPRWKVTTSQWKLLSPIIVFRAWATTAKCTRYPQIWTHFRTVIELQLSMNLLSERFFFSSWNSWEGFDRFHSFDSIWLQRFRQFPAKKKRTKNCQCLAIKRHGYDHNHYHSSFTCFDVTI